MAMNDFDGKKDMAKQAAKKQAVEDADLKRAFDSANTLSQGFRRVGAFFGVKTGAH